MISSFGNEIERIKAVTISVVDLEQSLHFYTNHWGLEEVKKSKDTIWLRGSGMDQYILVLQHGQSSGLVSITWEVSDQSSLAALRDRLAQASVDILNEPSALDTPGGGYGFSFKDPEGRMYQVVCDQQNHSVSYEDRTVPVKIAHVVVNTTQLEAMSHFLKHLGFNLSDSTKKMSFYRCDSNHHSIALANGDNSSLNHIAFEMLSWNDLMFGVGRLKLASYPIHWGVGRHGPGDNVFSYFIDPNGLVIEYTAEVQQITDPNYVPGTPEQWVRPPERMDQWGYSDLPSEAIKKAMSGQ
jgi:catechol 2,3-dioxygenase